MTAEETYKHIVESLENLKTHVKTLKDDVSTKVSSEEAAGVEAWHNDTTKLIDGVKGEVEKIKKHV